MKTIIIVALAGLIAQEAMAQVVNPSDLFRDAVRNGWTATPRNQTMGDNVPRRQYNRASNLNTVLYIMGLSDRQRHAQEMEQYNRKLEIQRRNAATPRFQSVGAYPVSSEGEYVTNALGTQWPGLNGYRGQQ